MAGVFGGEEHPVLTRAAAATALHREITAPLEATDTPSDGALIQFRVASDRRDRRPSAGPVVVVAPVCDREQDQLFDRLLRP